MNEKQDLLEKGTQYSRIELKTVQIKKAVVLCSGLFEQNSEMHFKKNSAISIKEPTIVQILLTSRYVKLNKTGLQIFSLSKLFLR